MQDKQEKKSAPPVILPPAAPGGVAPGGLGSVLGSLGAHLLPPGSLNPQVAAAAGLAASAAKQPRFDLPSSIQVGRTEG